MDHKSVDEDITPAPEDEKRGIGARKRNAQRGATMIEYSLVAAIMVTGLITGVYLLRQNMSETFSTVGSAVNTQ